MRPTFNFIPMVVGIIPKAVWLVNFALPLQSKCSFTSSKLRFVLLHEAQNFLNHMAFLMQNSKFKIQNS